MSSFVPLIKFFYNDQKNAIINNSKEDNYYYINSLIPSQWYNYTPKKGEFFLTSNLKILLSMTLISKL